MMFCGMPQVIIGFRKHLEPVTTGGNFFEEMGSLLQKSGTVSFLSGHLFPDG